MSDGCVGVGEGIEEEREREGEGVVLIMTEIVRVVCQSRCGREERTKGITIANVQKCRQGWLSISLGSLSADPLVCSVGII